METKENNGFVRCRCITCGGADVNNTALSEFVLKAGYGSQYDGQEIRLVMCGKCADYLFNEFYGVMFGRFEETQSSGTD